MKKLRIAVWHNLPSGGGKRALYHHVKGLVARGHTVEAWCPPTADQTYLPLGSIIPEHVLPFEYPYRASDNWIVAAYDRYRRVVELALEMERHVRMCADAINTGGFDILLANACMYFAAGPIGRAVTIPKAIYLGEPFRKLYESEPCLPWLARPDSEWPAWRVTARLNSRLIDVFDIQGKRLQAREERENAAAFDEILVNSFFSRESVLRAYGLEAKVCPLGVDSELFRPLHLSRENCVVGLGSMTRSKRPDRAIRALGTIPAEDRPDLIWVGNYNDEDYGSEIAALAGSCGVNVVLKIRVSDEELVEILNRAAVMVYTPQLEPFGFAPLEANACGTPVVAIAEGGVRESVVDGVNGVLVPDDDPRKLGAAIFRLLQDRDLARAVGEKGSSEVATKWTWDKAIDRLEERLLALHRK